MWRVSFHVKRVSSNYEYRDFYETKWKFKAFLVYIHWKYGYTFNEYEVKDVRMYKMQSKVIYLDAYRNRRGYYK